MEGIGDIIKALLPSNPGEGPPLPGALKQRWPDVIARVLPKIDIEEPFKKLIDKVAPPLPEQIDGELRKKINDIVEASNNRKSLIINFAIREYLIQF